MMTTITDIRLMNFIGLLTQFVRQEDFAEKVDVTPSYISQLKAGKPIGNGMARKIESSFGKPKGWMDVPHDKLSVNSPIADSALGAILMLSENLGIDLDMSPSEIIEKYQITDQNLTMALYQLLQMNESQDKIKAAQRIIQLLSHFIESEKKKNENK